MNKNIKNKKCMQCKECKNWEVMKWCNALGRPKIEGLHKTEFKKCKNFEHHLTHQEAQRALQVCIKTETA